ncbi:MAG: thiamine phosphate synthase [Proteobacteria bacterium]|nr:thiamine phosphate synthase [Pseudomonadota bacterium]MBU1709615.1 thiamine phosphate synthase [Pseudomonadota bacterium]
MSQDWETSPSYQKRLSIFINEVTIYPVSCEKLSNGRTDRQWIDKVLAGGARIVQLRDKLSDDRTLLEKAHYFRRKSREAGALFIVNNRLDIALLSDADGIHLGNSDIPTQEARRLAPELIIGVSCNTREQAASAKARGASYFNIGPLFHTGTKQGLSTFLGSEAIADFSSVCDLPYSVMGGIKLDHVEELAAKGARRIAVVTALTQAEDVENETRKWINRIKSAQQK